MRFDLSICKACFWYNQTWCDAEYHKRAEEVYDKCEKHLSRYKGQMSFDDLIKEANHDD